MLSYTLKFLLQKINAGNIILIAQYGLTALFRTALLKNDLYTILTCHSWPINSFHPSNSII